MSNQPNVLLITTDHWSGSLLGAAGHPVIKTPTLDELCRAGVRFDNAYSECPVCIPARRTLMTGTTPLTHGDRVFKDTLPMPDLPALAQCFRDAGYQAYAVGKLHVYPQRDRIGFDDVILDEEGRLQYGVIDDYEMYLADRGFTGKQFAHGMSNNQYAFRTWHLPEDCHPTNWATEQMVRTIKRRDPKRPSFWYISYRHPHPPLVPLASYLDMYDPDQIDTPLLGSWLDTDQELPFAIQLHRSHPSIQTESQIIDARRAFYALCTHIDHQLRYIIGTLREEGELDNTIICFTADHGDVLGNNDIWAKRSFYEGSANIPMFLLDTADGGRVSTGSVDDRLVGLQDVMPTLLGMAGIKTPESVEGLSMVGENRRPYLYGECNENDLATRMIRNDRYKLIYYSVGNAIQLFDMVDDRHELNDLSDSPDYSGIVEEMTAQLINELNGDDLDWVDDGKLVGIPNKAVSPAPNRGLSGQRGGHWPQPPITNLGQGVMP